MENDPQTYQEIICSPDQEALVSDRIRCAVRMSLALNKTTQVGADQTAYGQAVESVINGNAIEVIKIMGMNPPYVNLRRPTIPLI